MKCKNLHKYKRVNIGRKDTFHVFQCIECPHYLRPEVFVGKSARCIYCDSEFKIQPLHKKLVRIHCLDCTKSKNTKEEAALQDLLTKLKV